MATMGIHDLSGAVKGLGTSMINMHQVGTTLAIAGVAGFGLAVVGAIKSAAALESAMADVQRITGKTGSEIDELSAGFVELSQQVPQTATQLARVGVIAAQLGISGAENIKAVALEASKLARVSDLTEQSAAAAFARLSTVLRLNVLDAHKLGSAMVILANTTTATAGFIVDATVRFGALGERLGISTGTLLAFSATMRDSGLRAEAGGTAIARFFGLITTRQKDFARVLGISVSEFDKRLGEDATGVIMKFLGTLSRLDAVRASQVLKQVGLSAVRSREAVFSLSQDMDKLRRNINNANDAFEEGTKLQRSFEAVIQTLNSQIDILVGKIKNIFIEVGQILLPIVKAVVAVFNELIDIWFRVPSVLRSVIAIAVIAGASFATFILAMAGLTFILPKVLSGFIQINSTLTGTGERVKGASVSWAALKAEIVKFVDLASAKLKSLRFPAQFTSDVGAATALMQNLTASMTTLQSGFAAKSAMGAAQVPPLVAKSAMGAAQVPPFSAAFAAKSAMGVQSFGSKIKGIGPAISRAVGKLGNLHKSFGALGSSIGFLVSSQFGLPGIAVQMLLFEGGLAKLAPGFKSLIGGFRASTAAAAGTTGMMGKVSFAIKGLSKFLLTNPIGIIIFALLVIIPLTIKWIKEVSKLGLAMRLLLGIGLIIVLSLFGPAAFFLGVIIFLVTEVVAAIRKFIEVLRFLKILKLINVLFTEFSQIASRLIKLVTDIKNAFENVLKAAFEPVRESLEKLFSTISKVSGAFDVWLNKVVGPGATFSKAFETVLLGLAEPADKVAGALKKIVDSASDMVTEFIAALERGESISLLFALIRVDIDRLSRSFRKFVKTDLDDFGRAIDREFIPKFEKFVDFIADSLENVVPLVINAVTDIIDSISKTGLVRGLSNTVDETRNKFSVALEKMALILIDAFAKVFLSDKVIDAVTKLGGVITTLLAGAMIDAFVIAMQEIGSLTPLKIGLLAAAALARQRKRKEDAAAKVIGEQLSITFGKFIDSIAGRPKAAENVKARMAALVSPPPSAGKEFLSIFIDQLDDINENTKEGAKSGAETAKNTSPPTVSFTPFTIAEREREAVSRGLEQLTRGPFGG